MAFKMKGSAFKLGNVATKSVLKQKEDPIKEINRPEPPKDEVPGPPMKSPLEHSRTLLDKADPKTGRVYRDGTTVETDYHSPGSTLETWPEGHPEEHEGSKREPVKNVERNQGMEGPPMKSPLEHKAENDRQFMSWDTEGGKKGKLWEHDGVRYDQEGLKEHRANTEKKEERAKVSEASGTKKKEKFIDAKLEASGPPMKSPLEQGEQEYLTGNEEFATMTPAFAQEENWYGKMLEKLKTMDPNSQRHESYSSHIKDKLAKWDKSQEGLIRQEEMEGGIDY